MKMKSAVFIKCKEVSDESHVKKFVYFDLAENKWLFAASISVSMVGLSYSPPNVVGLGQRDITSDSMTYYCL